MRLLEALQRRWTREILGVRNSTYRERLQTIGLYSVYGRLLRNDLVKVWKAFNGSPDVGLSSLFTVSTNTHTRGHAYKLVVPVARSEARRRTFAVRVVVRWNGLPSSVVESPTVSTFKSRLDNFLGVELFSAL